MNLIEDIGIILISCIGILIVAFFIHLYVAERRRKRFIAQPGADLRRHLWRPK